jgi:chorismate mutase/prephenate dehydratase
MDDKKDLETIRETISEVDNQILELLAKRRSISNDVAKAKVQDGSSLRDPKREQEILGDYVKKGKQQGLDSYFVTKIFHEIINDSIRTQLEYLQSKGGVGTQEAEIFRIAFHGIEGSYSHLAALKYFAKYGEKVIFIGKPTFEAVAKTLEDGQADYAIMPIENTTSGGNNEVYDILLHSQISIIGEEKFKLNHCLIASGSVNLNQIKRVYCRPQVANDCSEFLASLPNVKIELLSDSALSVKKIKDEGDPAQVAIASEDTAKMFGMTIVQKDIANQEESYNRYIITARKPEAVDLRIPCKTSLVMATEQKAGSLVEALLVFRDRNINLTKLESRPIPGNPWEEMFYVDFEGNVQEDTAKEALQDLTRKVRFIKTLGCYPSYDLTKTQVQIDIKPEAKIASGKKETTDAKQAAPQASKGPKKAYRLASRDHKPDDTIIDVKGVKIGGDNFVVIAGPCSVESYDQIMVCAKEAKENGTHILRGGCFKPRTSPYSFQGLGLKGLDFLVDAGKTYSMPIITEVMSEDDIGPVAAKSDILQVGARNMQNFSLLKALGRTHRPIMLKRGLSSTIEDLLMAVEYILSEGNQQVFLCERGIRTFETATRNTLDISAVPVLKKLTHLPVFIDPSHAAGERDLVVPLALAAKAVGAHGIMVEFHPEPEKALSDGPQALRFPQFESMMQDLLGR